MMNIDQRDMGEKRTMGATSHGTVEVMDMVAIPSTEVIRSGVVGEGETLGQVNLHHTRQGAVAAGAAHLITVMHHTHPHHRGKYDTAAHPMRVMGATMKDMKKHPALVNDTTVQLRNVPVGILRNTAFIVALKSIGPNRAATPTILPTTPQHLPHVKSITAPHAKQFMMTILKQRSIRVSKDTRDGHIVLLVVRMVRNIEVAQHAIHQQGVPFLSSQVTGALKAVVLLALYPYVVGSLIGPDRSVIA